MLADYPPVSRLSQTHHLRPAALQKVRLNAGGNLSDSDVLLTLKRYLQASSALSFAARAQEFTDGDLEELHVRAGDYVRRVA